jgi:hypothetical protein
MRSRWVRIIIAAFLSARRQGDLVVRGWLYGLGWLATGAMALCIVGMAITAVIT